MAYSNSVVLLVDDDAVARHLQRRAILKRYRDAITISANDGAVAIDEILSRYVSGDRLPTHIFLDLAMPEVNGWTFLDHFRRLPAPVRRACRIAVVTGQSEGAERARALSDPLIDHVIEKHELEARLPEVIADNGI